MPYSGLSVCKEYYLFLSRRFHATCELVGQLSGSEHLLMRRGTQTRGGGGERPHVKCRSPVKTRVCSEK